MVVNKAGTYTFSSGKHLARPGYWVPPSATLSEDDLAGPIQVSPFYPADAAANEVQGTFIDPDKNYQGAPFTTKSVTSADVRQVNLDLAFITSIKRADRIANIMLKRAQCEKTVTWPMNIAGLGTRALDTVQLDTSRYGLSNYAFVVSSWGLSSDYGVVVSLREENAEIYDGAVAVTPVTVPDPVVPTVPVVTETDTQTVLRATYPTGHGMTAVDAGTSATITIDVRSGFTSARFDYPGTQYDVTVTNLPQSFTGLAYSTLYYGYVDVSDLGDEAPIYGVTTSYAASLNSATNPYRIPLNQSITTPAAGGASTGSSGSGGGYGGTGGGGGLTSYP
jgi:hypothetical protein